MQLKCIVDSQKLQRVMRLTTILIFAASLHVAAKTEGQTITLDLQNVPIQKVFNEASRQTGISIIYNETLFKGLSPISINLKNASMQDVLNACLKDQPFEYAFEGNLIVIKKKNALTFNVESSVPPPVDIHGKITDSLGNPLVGASVTVKGVKETVATDANGEFLLKNAGQNAILIVSYIGYERKEIKYKSDKYITVSLRVATHKLGDVEVTYNSGYQVIPAERATGSFAFVDNALFNQRVSTDVLSRLEDNVPGLLFNRNLYGAASSTTSKSTYFNIRGQNTIYGNADPLFVVDNFPYDGDINQINPNDVENVTILKDAAAASIWGARAANGVVVITLKKGHFNRPVKVSFNSNVTIGAKTNVFYQSQMTSSDFIDVEKVLFSQGFYDGADQSSFHTPLTPVAELLIAERNGIISEASANTQIDALRKIDTRNDLSKYFYRNSVDQQYAMNMSGGDAHQRYYLSVGYDKNDNSHVGDSYDRLTINGVNTYGFLQNKLELTAGIYFTQTNSFPNSTTYNPSYSIGTSAPYYPYAKLADANGNPLPVTSQYRQSFAVSAPQMGLLDWQLRPLEELRLVDDNIKVNDYRVNANLKYQFIPSLNFEVLYQYESSSGNGRNLQSQDTYFTRDQINLMTQIDASGNKTYPLPLGGILDQTRTDVTGYDVRAQFNFDHRWGTEHELVAIAGYEQKQLSTMTDVNRFYGYDPEHSTVQPVAYNIFYPLYPYPGYTSTIPFVDNETSLTDRYRSYYANAGYTFHKIYTLTASIRLDQSNIFGVNANQKGVPLYSVGTGWNVSQANFYNVSWLPFLKLRATYGYNGNVYKNLSAYTTAAPSIEYDYSPSTLLPYAIVQNPPNPKLQWERVRVINFGVDFSTKNEVLSGSFEYYLKNGYDLIGSSETDPTTGISIFQGNNATTSGHGIDVKINTRNIDGKFKWYTTFIYSEVHDYVNQFNVPTSPGFLTLFQGTPQVGKPLFAIYSRTWAGLDPANGDPQGYLNGKISKDYNALTADDNSDNLKYSGSAIPTFFGSMRNTFSYQHFGLSFNISYRIGYYFKKPYISYGQILTAHGGSGEFEKRWQKPGDEAHTSVPSMPTAIDGYRDYFYGVSEAQVGKGDHIRFQDISLSYDITRQQLPKLPFSDMRVYLYANNLGIIWKANQFGLDPDYAITPYGPPPRSISIGLKLDF